MLPTVGCHITNSCSDRFMGKIHYWKLPCLYMYLSLFLFFLRCHFLLQAKVGFCLKDGQYQLLEVN